MTMNDVALLRLDNIDNGVPTSGLVAIAAPDVAGFSLVPLSTPIHARVQWINAAKDYVRVFDPIAIQHAEATDISQVWNPLRTAASFFALPESATSRSTLVLVCPTRVSSAAPSGRPWGFLSCSETHGRLAHPLRVRVYDDDEVFLRDLATTCNCLSQIPLPTLSTIYSDQVSAPSGTYTEIEGATRQLGSAPSRVTSPRSRKAGIASSVSTMAMR